MPPKLLSDKQGDVRWFFEGFQSLQLWHLSHHAGLHHEAGYTRAEDLEGADWSLFWKDGMMCFSTSLWGFHFEDAWAADDFQGFLADSTKCTSCGPLSWLRGRQQRVDQACPDSTTCGIEASHAGPERCKEPKIWKNMEKCFDEGRKTQNISRSARFTKPPIALRTLETSYNWSSNMCEMRSSHSICKGTGCVGWQWWKLHSTEFIFRVCRTYGLWKIQFTMDHVGMWA